MKYSNLQLAKKFLQYYRKASNSQGHGMHSPFVFDFILHVLNNRKGYEAPVQVEALRKKLLSDPTLLEIEDLGAGSRSGAARQRSIGQLARTALKPKKYAQLLYRLARHYQPRSIIELGTSLGLTTSYFALAHPPVAIHTIEGSPAIAAAAGQNFEALGISSIRQHIGNFDQLLPVVLQELPSPDLVYIDGNHRLEPTLDYFLQCRNAAHADTILVFDDIHWSPEMEQAWDEIRKHPDVRYTVDLFFLGFVFFRNDFKVKQDFSIRF